MNLTKAIETASRTLRTAGNVSVNKSRYSAILSVTLPDLTVKTVWLTDLPPIAMERVSGSVLWPFVVDPDYIVSFTGPDDEFVDRLCSVAASMMK